MDITIYENLQEFYDKNPGAVIWMASTKAKQFHYDVKYNDGDYIMFGKETKGLPEDLLESDPDRTIRIPMRPGARCLNLSNAVAVTVYEVLRQGEFAGLQEVGKLGGCPSP